MSGKLLKIVEDAIKDKNIELNSFDGERIRAIERKINSDMKAGDVIKELSQREEKLRLKLERHDWEKIERSLTTEMHLKK